MFTNCPNCGRLNLGNYSCACQEPEPIPCDCTTTGNQERRGDKCMEREREAWRQMLDRYAQRRGGSNG